MSDEMKDRLNSAVDEAERAFWLVIAQKFPEAQYGDLDPMTSAIFSMRCNDVATQWVFTNTDLIPEEE